MRGHFGSSCPLLQTRLCPRLLVCLTWGPRPRHLGQPVRPIGDFTTNIGPIWTYFVAKFRFGSRVVVHTHARTHARSHVRTFVMHVCMYVCMHACMHACMYVCVHIYTQIYMYTSYTCICICICICMCICICICM